MERLITNLTASGAPIFVSELITPDTEQIYGIWGEENLANLDRRTAIWTAWNRICTLRYKGERGDVWSFPFQTLHRGYGDCEDVSFALCSLLRHNDFLSPDEVFVALGTYGRFGDGHAWCVLSEDGKYYVLEATLSAAPNAAVEETSPYFPYRRVNDVYSYELRPGFETIRRNVGRKNRQLKQFYGIEVK